MACGPACRCRRGRWRGPTPAGARAIVRIVNDARRKEGLQVTDRIRVMLSVPKDVEEAVQTHATYVMEETLADELSFHPHLTESHRAELPDGRAVHVSIHRV